MFSSELKPYKQLSTRNVITRYCTIRNHQITADGKILFQEQGGSLDTFLHRAYSALKIDYPKFYKMDTLSKLGFLAAEVLLDGRPLSTEYSAHRVALVLSNAHASLDTDLKYEAAAKTVASPALFVYTLPNIVAGEICIRHKLKGENAFFVSRSFDADRMTRYTELVPSDACLTGWVDVMGEHHDVFLYLTEKNKPDGLEHTARKVQELYTTSLWNN